jgi:putative ABC transport system permease protein
MAVLRFAGWIGNKIPVAWLLLIRFRAKFLTALAGIIFASILIHVQFGLRAALFESSITLFKGFNADAVIINKLTVSSTSLQPFDRMRLVIFDRYPEVTATMPVRYKFVRWRYPGLRESRLAIMVGFNPRTPVFKQEDIVKNQRSLIVPGRILYDELSRKEFGPVKQVLKAGREVIVFVNKERAKVAGLVRMGTSFSYDASFLTSLTTFQDLTNLNPQNIEIGLIKLAPGVNTEAFLASIQDQIPEDVRTYTLKEFMEFEQDYWDQTKPIGFVFAFNATLGFVVGMLILYQILYTDVTSHLPDFSTMLALAFTYKKIRLIVFQESFLLTVIGYPLGVIGSMLLFELINSFTGLPVRMTIDRALICFGVILLMSTCSAFMAMQKLDGANPIEVFE